MGIVIISGTDIYSWNEFTVSYNKKCIISNLTNNETVQISGFPGVFLPFMINSLLTYGIGDNYSDRIDYTLALKNIDGNIVLNLLEYNKLVRLHLNKIEDEILHIINDPNYRNHPINNYTVKLFPGFEYTFEHECFQGALDGKKYDSIHLKY